MSGDDHLARLLAARSALASAEESTGLRPARAPLAPGGRGGPGGALGDPQPGPWLGVGAATSGAVALTGSTSALLALLAGLGLLALVTWTASGGLTRHWLHHTTEGQRRADGEAGG